MSSHLLSETDLGGSGQSRLFRRMVPRGLPSGVPSALGPQSVATGQQPRAPEGSEAEETSDFHSSRTEPTVPKRPGVDAAGIPVSCPWLLPFERWSRVPCGDRAGSREALRMSCTLLPQKITGYQVSLSAAERPSNTPVVRTAGGAKHVLGRVAPRRL